MMYGETFYGRHTAQHHNEEVQISRGTDRRRDEEQTM